MSHPQPTLATDPRARARRAASAKLRVAAVVSCSALIATPTALATGLPGPSLPGPRSLDDSFDGPGLNTLTWLPVVKGSWGETDFQDGFGPVRGALNLSLAATSDDSQYIDSEVISRYAWGTNTTLQVRASGRNLATHGGSNGVGFWNITQNQAASQIAWFINQEGTIPPYAASVKGFFIQVQAPGSGFKIIPLNPKLLDQVHTYTVDKHPTFVNFYIDDKLVAHVTGNFVPDGLQRADLWVDNAIYALGASGISRIPQPQPQPVVQSFDWINIVSGPTLPVTVSTPTPGRLTVNNDGALTATCSLPIAGTCTVRATSTLPGLATLGQGHVRLTQGGTRTVQIILSPAARTTLEHTPAATVHLSATAADAYGRRGTATTQARLAP